MVLFGWSKYTCTGAAWQGVLTFPRQISLDPIYPTRLRTYPIDAISELHVPPSPATKGAPPPPPPPPMEVTLGPEEGRLLAKSTQLDLALNVTSNACTHAMHACLHAWMPCVHAARPRAPS